MYNRNEFYSLVQIESMDLDTISTMYSGSLEEMTISERIVKSMCDDVIKKLK